MSNNRTTTWNNIGSDVNNCKSLEQVLLTSGLDYNVVKEPVFTTVEDQQILIPNRFVTMRDTDNHTYDVVSDKFEVIQNRDAFDFVNYMGDELQFEKAGETASGMVYIIGKLPDVDILGDAFTPYVIFRNGFTGKTKISAAISPLRIVCQNQFNFAFNNAQNTVNIRHVANAEQKLQEAKEILKLSADYMQQLNETASQYAGMKLTKRKVEQVIDLMFPMDNIEEMNSFKRNRLEMAREQFLNAYNNDDNSNFRGTAWGLINAYTDYITHKVPMGNSETKEEGKFMTVTFDPKAMNSIISALSLVA